MKKSYLIITLGIINLCYSLGMYIGSIEVSTSDGYFSFNSNMTYLIWFISSIIILMIGYISKKEEVNKVE